MATPRTFNESLARKISPQEIQLTLLMRKRDVHAWPVLCGPTSICNSKTTSEIKYNEEVGWMNRRTDGQTVRTAEYATQYSGYELDNAGDEELRPAGGWERKIASKQRL